MKLKIYQIDAFTDQVFSGNPAAVCILEEWLEDSLMQNIAAENNLAETVFLVKKDHIYDIRWFTPAVEVDLCGHATLAAAYVLFEMINVVGDKIYFYSHRSGDLMVERSDNDLLLMDFPADTLKEISPVEILTKAFGKVSLKTFMGKTDYMLVFANQQEIEQMKPNMGQVAMAGERGVIITAPGDTVDFVSRFFAPQSGIDEDPVTGSAHTTLTPYWSEVLNKKKLTAKQLSKRGGNLLCEFLGERVTIAGKAVPYMVGEIDV